MLHPALEVLAGLALGRKDWSKHPPPIHPFTIHPSFFLLSLLPLTLPRLTDIYCLRSTFCKGSSAGGLSGRQDRAGEMPSEHVTWAGAFCPHWGALGREWPRGLRLRVSL